VGEKKRGGGEFPGWLSRSARPTHDKGWAPQKFCGGNVVRKLGTSGK